MTNDFIEAIYLDFAVGALKNSTRPRFDRQKPVGG